MKIHSFLLMILLVAGNVSAECREKSCMPNEYLHNDRMSSVYFYYDSIFEIGTNWFIIFEYDSAFSKDNISFEFHNGPVKIINLAGENSSEESVSFPGSSFTSEEFHKILYINFTDGNGQERESFELEVHINKPPAEDMRYLWGGMTIFWISIGAYVLYLSSKYKELSNKLGLVEDGDREKN